ncbi:hypothetical protein GPA10_36365 [Streptomyces sp. p1417]|uniref:Excreted virulence factor EspC, type VII ESX diderm n=1 Tax=Streptomyces typhae TaxID=2681492 RepID=A0A6L6X838_9ACTN|nr:hypothetical protein [Streptomyces typhae]MVO90083.1 hypothetical protein [Streptomyces typhae]
MAWEEWEQLKAAAIARESSRMQLNQVPPEPGGDGGTLVSNKAAWSRAGHDVGSFREPLAGALRALSDGQGGLGADAGCRTGAAQKDVYDSWERYVERLGKRCGRLAGLLEKAGSDQYRTDESIMTAIGNLKVAYADTPALGGDGPGPGGQDPGGQGPGGHGEGR